MGPRKPAQKLQPENFGIGAPAAPPLAAPVFHLKPAKGPAADATRKQAELKKAQQAVKERDNAIFKARQEIAVKDAAVRRVTAKAGLPDTSSPFAGVNKGAGPGAAPYQGSNETDKTRLAKARGQLRTQGGLLSPAQRAAEAVAMLGTGTHNATTFSDTHQLPAALTKPAVSLQHGRSLQSADMGAPPPPETTTRAAGRGRTQTIQKPGGSGGLGGLFDTASRALGAGLEAAASVPGTALTPFSMQYSGGSAGSTAHPPVMDVKPTPISTASADVANRWNNTVTKATGKFGDVVRGHPNFTPPHIPIPKNFLNEQALAASQGQPVYVDQLTDKQRFGDFALGAKGRAYFVGMAGQNGYNVKDAPQWNDAELAARAFGPKNDPSVTGFLRNLAADVGTQAALASAPVMFADSAVQAVSQRSLAPVAKLGGQYLEGWLNLLPHFGDRPWLENIYERPLSTGLALAPGAKFLSGRVGRGLGAAGVDAFKGTRDVTLPTLQRAVEGGHLTPREAVVRMPASLHPGGRALQAAHDYILGKAQHPTERAAAAQRVGGEPNPAKRTAGAVSRALEPAGNALEQRALAKHLEALHMHSRLVAGTDPALALEAMFKAGRQLPFLRSLKTSWTKNGGKEGEFEALFKHHAAGTSGAQLAEAYRAVQKKVDEHITQLETDAAAKQSEAGLLRQEGKLDEARRAEESAKTFLHSAGEIRKHQARQEEQALYSQQSGIDIHAPKKGAQALVDTMRGSSRQAAEILKKQGLIDEKGHLFGDWQHRIWAIEHTEGPGTQLGGDLGTPGYAIAHAIYQQGGLREAHDVARAAYHGTTSQLVHEIPASMDVRTPLAEHHAGRNRLARAVLGVVEKKQLERNARVAATQHRDLLAEAQQSGLDARAVARVVRESSGHLMSLRTHHEMNSESRLSNMDEQIRSQEHDERAAFNTQRDDRISRLQDDLHVAETRNAPKVKQDELRAEIAREQQLRDTGFTPSARLLSLQRQFEKLDLHQHAYEMPAARIKQMVDGVRTSDGSLTKTPQQEALLRGAIQQEIDRHSNLNDVALAAKAMEQDSAALFRQHTGKSVELAHTYDRASANYLRGLRALRDQQIPLGHDPFHMHLHMPGEAYGLQPVRVTTGSQWEEGNYTRDMHFLVARDLTGLQRKAVEGHLFEQLSKEPMMIESPPVGSLIPPGWIATPKVLIDNLGKVSKDPGQIDQLKAQWRNLGTGTHAGKRVTDTGEFEGGTVLITRHMQEWMGRELDRGGTDMSRLLKATNAYRRWMLFSLPRTYINNTVGNPILAMVMGARLRDLTEAVRTLRNDPARIPHTERRKGPISNVMEKPNAKMVGWQAFWRNANGFSEDIGRVMVYLMHARKGFKQEHNLGMLDRVSYSNELWRDYLVKAARGETANAVGPAIKSAEAFGDMYKLMKHDKGLATAFLFHRWVGHMIHLTYWTLPTKYPGRALFIQQTAALADQYRKEHGEFPSWAQAYVPLWHEIQKAGGLPQDVVWSLGTGGVNPFATAGQTVDFGTVDQPKFPLQSLVANNLTPLLRVPIETGYGSRLDTLKPFVDYQGNAIGAGMDWHVLLNGIIANLPIANTVFPRAGLSDDTIQVPFPNVLGLGNDLHRRFTKQGAFDSSMLSPTAMGHGHLYDWLLRAAGAFGGPIRPVDAAGNRTRTSAYRTISWQNQQKGIRDSKKAASDYAAEVELWRRDPAAWRKKYRRTP